MSVGLLIKKHRIRRVNLFSLVYFSNSLRKSFRRKKEKPESHAAGASGEIDSITDAHEINAILNQLREDERQNELKRINQTIDENETRVKSPAAAAPQTQKPVHRAPPPPSRFTRGGSSASIDEDEMLNSIIGNDSSAGGDVASSSVSTAFVSRK